MTISISTHTLRQACQDMLAAVAARCDGARTLDGAGFAGCDVAFGHALARDGIRTDRGLEIALKLCRKYQHQAEMHWLEVSRQAKELGVEVQPQQQEKGTPMSRAPFPTTRGQANAATTTQPSVTSGPGACPAPETVAAWGEPLNIDSERFTGTLRKAEATEAFWGHWRAHKEQLRAAGISCGKDPKTGEWQACWWQKTCAQPKAEAAPVTVPDIPPAIAARLKDYQRPAAARMLAGFLTHGAYLDGSDTGTGKTYETCAVAATLNQGLVIICPKAVRPSWRNAWAHFGLAPDKCIPVNYEWVKTGKAGLGNWVVEPVLDSAGKPRLDSKGKPKTVEVFRWTLPAVHILVFDECHRCSARDTANSQILMDAVQQGAKVIALSATIADNPLKMRAIGYTLKLYQRPTMGAFFKWVAGNGCYRGRFGWEFNGKPSVMAKLHGDIFGSGRGGRMRIKDIPDFPESQVTAEAIDFGEDETAAMDRIYGVMEAELAALAARKKESLEDRRNREVARLMAQGVGREEAVKAAASMEDPVITIILRARQKTELLKVPALARMTEDAIEEGMSVALFVNFDETVQALCRLLKTDCTITGAQTGPKGELEREENRLRFQRGDFPRLSLINPTYSAQDIVQAKGRCHRAANAGEVLPTGPVSRVIICNIRAGGVGISLHNLKGAKSIQKILFADGTIEVDAQRACAAKCSRLELLNDGDLTGGLL